MHPKEKKIITITIATKLPTKIKKSFIHTLLNCQIVKLLKMENFQTKLSNKKSTRDSRRNATHTHTRTHTNAQQQLMLLQL